MFEVDYDIEKVSSFQGCRNCIFCLTKCPKCGSPKVEIQYHRRYFEDGAIQSNALLKCDCSKKLIEKLKLPEGMKSIEGSMYMEFFDFEYYYIPELKKCIDNFFEDINPIELVEVKLLYLLERDTEDRLSLFLYNDDSNVEFKNELPIEILMAIESDENENRHKNVDVRYVHLEEFVKSRIPLITTP